jgi:hypothetical protein
MEETEAEEKRLNWNRKVIGAYQNALAPLARIASSLLGLWAIACVLGWKRADAYYTSFGAEWVTSKLTILTLLSLSNWPVVALVSGVLITLTDLADRYDRGMKNVWRITYASMLAMLCMAWWFNWQEDYEKSSFSYLILLFNVALTLGLLLGSQVLDLAERSFKWSSTNIWVFSFLAAWFVLTVSSLGHAEGKRDRDVEQTTLEILETKDGGKYRLLFEKDGLIYAALLRETGNPRVKILDRQDVLYIYKPDPEPADLKGKLKGSGSINPATKS